MMEFPALDLPLVPFLCVQELCHSLLMFGPAAFRSILKFVKTLGSRAVTEEEDYDGRIWTFYSTVYIQSFLYFLTVDVV